MLTTKTRSRLGQTVVSTLLRKIYDSDTPLFAYSQYQPGSEGFARQNTQHVWQRIRSGKVKTHLIRRRFQLGAISICLAKVKITREPSESRVSRRRGPDLTPSTWLERHNATSPIYGSIVAATSINWQLSRSFWGPFRFGERALKPKCDEPRSGKSISVACLDGICDLLCGIAVLGGARPEGRALVCKESVIRELK